MCSVSFKHGCGSELGNTIKLHQYHDNLRLGTLSEILRSINSFLIKKKQINVMANLEWFLIWRGNVFKHHDVIFHQT